MPNYAEMELKEITKLPGVVDLTPLKCRAGFARALRLEAQGDHTGAEKALNEAVLAEAQQE